MPSRDKQYKFIVHANVILKSMSSFSKVTITKAATKKHTLILRKLQNEMTK